MNAEIVTDYQREKRSYWINEISHLSGNFGEDSQKVEQEIAQEIQLVSQNQAMVLLQEVFKSVEAMNPSKNANNYWQVVNRIFLDSDKSLSNIWKDEKQASIESICISKEEAILFLSQERERIMRMSKEEAIQELIKINKIDNKTKAVNSVASHGLLDIL